VSISDTELVLRDVAHGRAHIGLVGGQGGDSHLDFSQFACDELTLIVPPSHAWWRRKRVTVSELLSQPLVQRELGSGSRQCLERALARVGIAASQLNVALELGSNEAVKRAVLEGAGLAVLSRRVVESEVIGERLRTVAVDGLTLNRDMYVVRDRRRVLPPPAQHFVTVVQSETASPVQA
jgi:DNA-binding transcriptional LysR family regulator